MNVFQLCHRDLLVRGKSYVEKWESTYINKRTVRCDRSVRLRKRRATREEYNQPGEVVIFTTRVNDTNASMRYALARNEDPSI